MGRKLIRRGGKLTLDKVQKVLESMASALEREHPGAASLREGLEETLTVARLGLPPTLRRTLRSTNPIESAFETVRQASGTGSRCCVGRRPGCWRLRSVSAGFKGTGNFRSWRRRCGSASVAWIKGLTGTRRLPEKGGACHH